MHYRDSLCKIRVLIRRESPKLRVEIVFISEIYFAYWLTIPDWRSTKKIINAKEQSYEDFSGRPPVWNRQPTISTRSLGDSRRIYRRILHRLSRLCIRVRTLGLG